MRAELANLLLARVMGWQEDEFVREIPELQALANYKYDEYANFEPGVKFMESLAQWLYQFETHEERSVAYRLVRERLVFVSNAEILRLVRGVYPDVIRPIIREEVAQRLNIPKYCIHKIESSKEFRIAVRQCLFLGMSDGAHIDAFRRSSLDLDNEQVYGVYEPNPARLRSMRKKLAEALAREGAPEVEPRFKTVFLLDDFAGSGSTILRPDGEGFDGRLKKVAEILGQESEERVFDPQDVRVVVCLYVATEKALIHLNEQRVAFEAYLNAKGTPSWRTCVIVPVLRLPDSIRITPEADPDIASLLDKYYHDALNDRKSYGVGGKSIKYGYSDCALPLILHHNTPNNSLFLLWKEGFSDRPYRKPLFGRFERHREPVGANDGV